MKFTLSFFTLTFISLFVSAQSQTWQWATSPGGTSVTGTSSMTTDAAGNIYMAGIFENGTITFGSYTLTNSNNNNAADFFIVKYNASGTVVWAMAGGVASVESIACDSTGNLYVTGGYEGSSIKFGTTTLTNTHSPAPEFFIAKYDSAGQLRWAKDVESRDESSMGYAISAIKGYVYVTGTYIEGIVFGNINLRSDDYSTTDIFLVKFDTSGNAIWATTGGSQKNDLVNSITLDAQGNSWIAGDYYGKVFTAGGNTITNTDTSGLSTDFFLAKYDSSGNCKWIKSAYAIGTELVRGIASDKHDNIFVAGSFSGTSVNFGSSTLVNNNSGSNDIFIAKYDSTGKLLWVKNGGGANFATTQAAAIDSAGNFYVTGRFTNPTLSLGNITLTNSYSLGTNDVFVFKCDSAGDFLWAINPYGTGADEGEGVAVDAKNHLYVSGDFASTSIAFGNITLANSNNLGGYNDVFLANLSNNNVVFTGTTNGSSPIDMAYPFPNPSSGVFYIKTNNYQSSFRVLITNMLGQEIYSVPVISNSTLIDLTLQPQGVYFYQLKNTGAKIQTGKMIVE